MRITTAVLLCLFTAICLNAQSDRGTITGTITDSTGAVIMGAQVSARNVNTGAETTTETTSTGNYVVSQLPVGSYELTVQVQGFKKYVRTGITVQVAETARLDVSLQVGSLSESIEVTANASLLKTESADQSSTVSGEVMDSLPLNISTTNGGWTRDLVGFVTLTPGTWMQPATTTNSSNNNIRVNGLPNQTFGLRLDGQDFTTSVAAMQNCITQPSIDAIEEYTLQTSNYAAEYGTAGGGLFNFTSRSGTNEFHGTAYEYLRNEKLNAGQPFTNNGNGGHLRPNNRSNDWGGAVGGPLIIPHLYNGRNKTFIFINDEEFRNKALNPPSQATLPTLAMRSGDFSQPMAATNNRVIGTDALGSSVLQNQVFDPASATTVNGTMVRTPFPGNIIPLSRMDPVAVKVQALIPVPTYSTLTNNFQQYYTVITNQDNFSTKFDHIFADNSKLSIFGQLFSTRSAFNNSDGLPVPLTGYQDQRQGTNSLRINYDKSLTPTLLFHLGAGYMRMHTPARSEAGTLNYDAVAGLGLKGSLLTPSAFPKLTFSSASYGGSSLSLGPSDNTNRLNSKPTGLASLSWVHGNHSIKFGAEWRRDIYSYSSVAGAWGTYGFSNDETAQIVNGSSNIGGNTSGLAYASFLLGAVDSGNIKTPWQYSLASQGVNLYLQDTWRVTPKLTLDYGLRWDGTRPYNEQFNRMSGFSPTVANPSAGGLLGATVYEGSGAGTCNCNFIKNYPFAIGPRLGLAYQITPKTVLRAGWGIEYGFIVNGWGMPFATGQAGWYQLPWAAPSPGVAAFQFSGGLPYTMAQLQGHNYDPGIAPVAGAGISAYPATWWDPNGGRQPRIEQWSMSLQREVTKDLMVEGAYVGNRGAFEQQASSLIDINGLTPQRLATFGLNINSASDRTLLTSAMNSPAVMAAGFKAPYPGFPMGLVLAQALRPYPQFTTISSTYSPLGDSWYDALQVKATKRTSHGLTASFAFTYQKELTTAEGPYVGDVYNRSNLKEISASSQPFETVFSITYQIPNPAKGNKFTKGALTGWRVGGIFRYASGLPIQVPCSTNNLNTILLRINTCDPDNRVPGVNPFNVNLNSHSFDPQKTFVLNPAAWTDPGPGNWGTSAAFYNDYRYQRRPDEQGNLSRSFRLREGMTLLFRVEFFNIFNRTEPNNPTITPITATQVTGVGGFGYINVGTTAANPRNGQAIARLQW
jgi:Carboxypeptidase regulatory-like domain